MWGNVAVTQAYLTISEVLGHVGLLVRDGQARELERDDVVRFAARALTQPGTRSADGSAQPKAAYPACSGETVAVPHS